VASLVNILDDEVAKCVGDYIARFFFVEVIINYPIAQAALQHSILSAARCQTYEGGIAGEPHAEAHGGYVSDFSENVMIYLCKT
jgi:protein farnesyltransferase subunit beta